MIAFGFATLMSLLGLNVLIKGSFQLNRYLVLRGAVARVAGLILMLPFLAGLFLIGFTAARWQEVAQSLLGCSYIIAISVLAFAALGAGLAQLGRKERLLNGSESKARSNIILTDKKPGNAHRSVRL